MAHCHIANAVVDLIPEKHSLHYMWEDNDIEGSRAAYDFYDWLEKHSQNQFILIDTGDYIVPECCRVSDPPYHNCENYDAHYYLYLVPMAIWEACRDEVMTKDAEWREQAKQCKQASK
jgi:hypothetical protein